ncbi:MAG: YdcF family protein [Polyangiaceae bacterium]|nr:YdcF family protein [Polyangiaceae bacterium]
MADAIAVLGCRVRPSGGVLGGAAGRRVRRAIEAYRAGVAPRVVACGGRRWDGVPEADALADALIAGGVPPEAILRERWSVSTAENARYTAALAHGLGLRSVVVVTCDWHLPRAVRCFRAAGFAAVGAGAPSPPGRAALRWPRERASELLELARSAVARRGLR